MSVYIKSSLCTFSDDIEDLRIENKEAWTIFDAINSELDEALSPFGVYIERESFNDHQEMRLVIHNGKRGCSQVLYSGSEFKYDLSIEDDDTFIRRAAEGLKVIRELDCYQPLAHLLFSTEPHKLHFATS